MFVTIQIYCGSLEGISPALAPRCGHLAEPRHCTEPEPTLWVVIVNRQEFRLFFAQLLEPRDRAQWATMQKAQLGVPTKGLIGAPTKG